MGQRNDDDSGEFPYDRDGQSDGQGGANEYLEYSYDPACNCDKCRAISAAEQPGDYHSRVEPAAKEGVVLSPQNVFIYCMLATVIGAGISLVAFLCGKH